MRGTDSLVLPIVVILCFIFYPLTSATVLGTGILIIGILAGALLFMYLYVKFLNCFSNLILESNNILKVVGFTLASVCLAYGLLLTLIVLL